MTKINKSFIVPPEARHRAMVPATANVYIPQEDTSLCEALANAKAYKFGSQGQIEADKEQYETEFGLLCDFFKARAGCKRTTVLMSPQQDPGRDAAEERPTETTH